MRPATTSALRCNGLLILPGIANLAVKDTKHQPQDAPAARASVTLAYMIQQYA